MKETILVTGGTGFIGYHLLKKLKRKFSIFSISSKKPSAKRKIKNVKYLNCDISKKKSLFNKLNKLRKIDYVINLAGYVDHSNKKKTSETHYYGCKYLVDFFSSKKIKLFVQIGSSLEYGNQKTPHHEKLKCYPMGTYGKSKLKSTKYILKISKKKNLPSIILRLYQIYGPNQSINRLIPAAIDSCLKNKKFKCSSGIQIRDFLYVEDLINLINKIICTKKRIRGIYNVGSNNPKRVIDIINTIQNKIKKGQPLFGEISMRKDEQMKYFPSTQKLSKILSWKPKISINYGLSQTIKSYR